MSNALRQFISRFQSKSASYNVTIAGLDGSGKTTFLSLLKLGEVVQVIPSLGLNVESVEFPMASGRVFKFTGWDVGAGSCNISTSKMIELHTVNGDAMIWVVDSCDRTRLPECVEDFTSAIGRVNSHRLRVGTAQRDYPILMWLSSLYGFKDILSKLSSRRLANKQDHPEAMSVVDLRKAFAKALSGRTVSIFETSLTRGVVKGGILDALDWLLLALEEASTRHSNTVRALQSQTAAVTPFFQQVPCYWCVVWRKSFVVDLMTMNHCWLSRDSFKPTIACISLLLVATFHQGVPLGLGVPG